MTIGATLLQVGGGVGVSVPGLILHATFFSKIILLLLLGISVYSWAVIWMRSRLFAAAERADRTFLEGFRRMEPGAEFRLLAEQAGAGTLGRTALAGDRVLRDPRTASLSAPEKLDLARRAMDRAASEETARLEHQVGFLATTGSVSPFLGLLGTVWGVMSSFLSIGGQGSASLAVVAPGIAEALIATVAGLATAIPAVVAYNHFLGRIREIANVQAQFTSEFLDRRVYGI